MYCRYGPSLSSRIFSPQIYREFSSCLSVIGSTRCPGLTVRAFSEGLLPVKQVAWRHKVNWVCLDETRRFEEGVSRSKKKVGDRKLLACLTLGLKEEKKRSPIVSLENKS